MNEDNTASTSSDNISADQASSSQINEGFAEVNQRFDKVETLIQDSDAYQNEVLDNVIFLLTDPAETDETENTEVQEVEEEPLPYAAILSSIDDKLDLQNHLFVGQFFMLGIITGVLLFRILWDRFKP